MKLDKHFLGGLRQLLRRKYSYFLFDCSKRKEQNTQILQSVKDKYKGRRAFVVCNYYTRRIKGNCVFVDTRVEGSTIYNPFFFEDITDHLAAVSTVTYAMIQILVHLGIREIYIIGCDNSYNKEKLKDGTIITRDTQSYFSGADDKDNNIIGTTWQNNETFKYARKYAEEHEITIKNATRGGYLEIFDRVDFDSLFN